MQPLRVFRDAPAYVLLGDAGAGKTTEFRRERNELGEEARFVTARDFVRLEPDQCWRNKTLFIDGLDEMRVGVADVRVPLDEIRQRLQLLDLPRFRISCREADWLGSNDRQHLEAVAPEGRIRVLRLDPLRESAALELLSSRLGDEDARNVAELAYKHELQGMLTNPLTLDLLVAAFAWHSEEEPQSRIEVFERACRRMAQEHNSEHLIGGRAHRVEALLAAAGELCVRQLLPGAEGFSLEAEDPASSFVPLDGLGLIDGGSVACGPDLWRAALATKLFVAVAESSNAAPVRLVPRHRQVAEFLAGRCLARLADASLSVRRAVALMTSPVDGRVVTSLRGLSAWFAAHSNEALDVLIDADPIGVGLYGDIGGKRPDQFRRILNAVAAEASGGPLMGHQWRDRRAVGFRDTTAWAFRSLAVKENEDAIRNLLADRSDEVASERVAYFLLEVLAAAEIDRLSELSGLAAVCEVLVCDETRPAHIRVAALDAYLHLVPAGSDRDQNLARHLHEIRNRRMSDPGGGLADTLLGELYPNIVGPADIWQHLHPQVLAASPGSFHGFWHYSLRQRSSLDQIAELLDAFSDVVADLLQPLKDAVADRLPRDLLADILGDRGDDIDHERLFRWLSAVGACSRNVATDENPTAYEAAAKAMADHGEVLGYPGATEELRDPIRRIRSWLEARSGLQKAMLLRWLISRDEDGPLGFEAFHWCDALCGSRPPGDLGLWYLEQAIEHSETEPEIAEELLRLVFHAVGDSSIGAGLTLEAMGHRVSSIPLLREALGRLQRPSDMQRRAERHEQRRRAKAQERADQLRDQQQQWATHLRGSLNELAGNAYPAEQLGRLARAYYGLYHEVERHAAPKDRLAQFIGDDPDLIGAVLDAFRIAIHRPDVPEAAATISLRSASRQSWLAYPVLAGLDLADEEDPDGLDTLDDSLKRKALALHYCVPTGTSVSPNWHARWCEQAPELAADVIHRCAARALRDGSDYVPGLNELDIIADHDELKHAVRLKLLASYPSSATGAQLRNLDRLLAAVLAEPDREDLRELIQRKISLQRMSMSQRLHWLAAGWLAPDPRCSSELRGLLEQRAARIGFVAKFLRNASSAGLRVPEHLAERVDTVTQLEFITCLGENFGPVDAQGFATLEMEISEVVSEAITNLATTTAGHADDAIAILIDNPRLAAWHEPLRRAQEHSRVVQRDAAYRPPSMDEVERTLSNAEPANAADLTAMVLDRLGAFHNGLRGSATNPWRHFWNEDPHGNPTDPKPENSCRDFLLAEIAKHPLAPATAVPEDVHAAGKRADIGVRYGTAAVPIEIKPSMSTTLWTGLRNQLIEQYATDPAADGHGIYLVLWFGPDRISKPPNKQPPATPEELKRHLESTLCAEEARKISVVVVDVTKPGAARDR